MSFRRSAIVEVGGIYGDYPGTCLREESDLALRIAKAGHRLVYTPDAVVDHLPGEYAKGKRFDRRYVYYANRNSVVLLARVYGMDAPIVRRFLGTATREVIGELRRGLRGALSIGSVGPVPCRAHARRRDHAGRRRRGGGRRGRARRGAGHPLGPGPAAGARAPRRRELRDADGQPAPDQRVRARRRSMVARGEHQRVLPR